MVQFHLDEILEQTKLSLVEKLRRIFPGDYSVHEILQVTILEWVNKRKLSRVGVGGAGHFLRAHLPIPSCNTHWLLSESPATPHP